VARVQGRLCREQLCQEPSDVRGLARRDLIGDAPGDQLAPLWPPSGPKSMTWSAVLITSRLCSITTTECPESTSRFKLCKSRSMSAKMQARRRFVEEVQIMFAAFELMDRSRTSAMILPW
jgi:hypothetical protein